MQALAFHRTRSNMLLVGPPARVEALILAATGVSSTDLPTWPPGSSASHRLAGPGTVLVPNVQMLDERQQAELHQAIADWRGMVQVVATAPAPLYPLVRRGTFHEGLYYRLNMLCVQEPFAADTAD